MAKSLDTQELNMAIAEASRRATVDPDYRALALKDATSALSKVSTKPLPSDITIRFIDNSGPVQSIVLPDPIPEMEELSDLELEQVAGGNTSIASAWNR